MGSALPLALVPLLLALFAVAACAPQDVAREASESPAFPEGWPYAADAPPARGTLGMAASTDTLASAVGVEILEAGGNAVDAAVAVQFALAVVHPAAGNIGGGGFMVYRGADGETASLDFREEAPGAASADMYLDDDGEVTDASWVGHLASGVPGSVAGMAAAHERFGSLPWARLLEPAVRLARDGFAVSDELSASLASSRDDFERFPPAAEIFLPGDEAPPPGDTLRQADLARTLEAVAEQGPEVFYRGWIADSLVAEMERGGGIITHEDLAAYEAEWREPTTFRYRDRTVVSMPPPSSGGVTLAELLNIVEGYDLGRMGWHSADAIHVMVEAARRAYGDRNFYLGDPDFEDMPLERLTSQAYADSLRSTIDMDSASSSETFNRVPVESEQTTHFSVVDSAGNAVAITTTLNGSYGSGVVVRGAGFFMNNEMDDFTARPGVPNAYGLVQGEANAIEPGKRMLSSMSPTIVVGEDGRTELVTGTPGGATIITTVFQMITNHVDHDLPVRTSVNAPRFHHQNLPDRIQYERGGLDTAVVAELRARGHEVSERGGTSGDVASIEVGPADTLLGAGDPRGRGSAIGLGGG